MILINITMQIRPEKTAEWLAVADAYAKDVNSEEGCLFFQFARSLTDENQYVCIEGFKDADAGGAHVKHDYVKKFFAVMPDIVATQPQIIYIDTPHDGFGPMGEIQPRLCAEMTAEAAMKHRWAWRALIIAAALGGTPAREQTVAPDAPTPPTTPWQPGAASARAEVR
jgi:quinol monooxygenase YgiN